MGYANQNPFVFLDSTGLSTEVKINSKGKYEVCGGAPDEDKNIYIVVDDKRTDQILGQSLTPYSFLSNDDKPVIGAIINPDDSSGQEFLDNFESHTPDFFSYVLKDGKNGGKYDFKDLGIDSDFTGEQKNLYRYRGMKIQDETGEVFFASARDIGNLCAGYIAGRSGILSWDMARFGFDRYQGSEEPTVTQRAERTGYNLGCKQHAKDFARTLETILSHH